jgi:ribosomal protein S18 acetylase RimI-like enzyme
MSKSVEIRFSKDVSEMDFEFVYQSILSTYWAKGLSRERMKRAMQHSINIAGFQGSRQISYARIITDYATYAYLCDVFVSEETRGQGISKKMMEFLMRLPELHGIKRFALITKDAQSLYKKFGFENMERPEMYMEISRGHFIGIDPEPDQDAPDQDAPDQDAEVKR